MSRPALEAELFNLSDIETKRKLTALIWQCRDFYEVTLIPKRPTRRQRANRFWFGCVVNPLRKFLTSQGQCVSTIDVHEMLKPRCLPKDIFHPLTGELLETIPGESHTLSIEEFSEFTERGIHYVGDMFDIPVPSPELYYGKDLSHAEE